MIAVYKKFFLMVSITILLLVILYKSAKADDYKWIIIQSHQPQDNKVIMNHFPNSKIFQAEKNVKVN